MSTTGRRKAALYLASLAPGDRRTLLAALSAEQQHAVAPLLERIIANGWHQDGIASDLLASEIRGLTANSSLSVDDFIRLTKTLPADWIARLFAANSAVDTKFLLSLLELPVAKRVRLHMEEAPRLPDKLREALLAEAIGMAA